MMNWKSLRLFPQQSVYDALTCIDTAGTQFALVTDSRDIILGVITDGNIRRSLLAGISLESPVTEVMSTSPYTTDENTSAVRALHLMEEKGYSHLPVIDEKKTVCWVWSRKELQGAAPLANTVVLMAGGLGTRLGELTKDRPKPMLHVGDRPILKTVLESFIHFGFQHFFLAVNYMAEVITDHFGDGSRLGCHIQYLRESKRMGTAGALSLLPPQGAPFLVANADILTQLNMRCLLYEHLAKKSPATMVVKRHTIQVPYGVVDSDATGIMFDVREKPEFNFHVSAGIYALSPETLSLIPPDSFFDMPQLFQILIKRGQLPRVLETQDYWLDIGRLSDYELAQKDFCNHAK